MTMFFEDRLTILYHTSTVVSEWTACKWISWKPGLGQSNSTTEEL